MILVGRRRELAAVEWLLDRAVDGVGGVLVVAGSPGSGKTALADAAAKAARVRGLPVVDTAVAGAGARLMVFDDVPAPVGEQLEGFVGAGAAVLIMRTDAVAAGLVDLRLASWDVVSRRAVDLRLAPLTEPQLGQLLTDRSAEQVHAIWLATGGTPGPALELAASGDCEGDGDPVAALALRVSSRAQFLVPDVALLRLMETAAARDLPRAVRSRILIRWARELLADPSAAGQRRDLVDEAVRLAGHSGDLGALANALDGRLHALWDPLAASERLSTASRIIELARQAGDGALELRGLFWRFTALVELGDLEAGEAALVVYGHAGELAGDAQAAVVVLSRQALLAMVRGRLELAATLTTEVAQAGQRTGLADTARLTASLRGQLAVLRGDGEQQIPLLQDMARRLPGHFYEATMARVLAEAGHDGEALLELDRLLAPVLAGTGPRWLGAVADLAFVASRGGDLQAVEQLYTALTPYQGRLVVWGGANMITGPVDDLLGRLAGRLGRWEQARAHFDDAVTQEERLGALPWLHATLAARGRPGDPERSRALAARLGLAAVSGDEWRLLREGEQWRLEAGAETIRVGNIRGLHYLRQLVSAPGSEITALDLVAGGSGLQTSRGEPVLDAPARTAYRTRLAAVNQQLDDADHTGDVTRAANLAAERAALVAELKAATGLGGRPRQHSAEAERARVNATRALRTLISRLERGAPLAALHLRASLRTGHRFQYQPAAGGPHRWRVS